MVIPRSRHVMIVCAQCGAAAAEIALLPASTGNSRKVSELWHERDRLERTDFFGQTYWFARFEQMVDLFEAIQSHHWPLARGLNDDFVAFVCKACDQPYCMACWEQQTEPASISNDARSDATEDRDHASIWATCPHDHAQIVNR